MIRNALKCTFIAIATTTLSISAVADHAEPIISVGQEVDVSLESSQTRLLGEGYNSIKMVNSNPLRLSAFDREGSEILLSVNPQTGEIDDTEYAYWMDK